MPIVHTIIPVYNGWLFSPMYTHSRGITCTFSWPQMTSNDNDACRCLHNGVKLWFNWKWYPWLQLSSLYLCSVKYVAFTKLLEKSYGFKWIHFLFAVSSYEAFKTYWPRLYWGLSAFASVAKYLLSCTLRHLVACSR